MDSPRSPAFSLSSSVKCRAALSLIPYFFLLVDPLHTSGRSLYLWKQILLLHEIDPFFFLSGILGFFWIL